MSAALLSPAACLWRGGPFCSEPFVQGVWGRLAGAQVRRCEGRTSREQRYKRSKAQEEEEEKVVRSKARV